MSFEKKIHELNILLPEAKAPVGSYVATKIIGKFAFHIRSNFNQQIMVI